MACNNNYKSCPLKKRPIIYVKEEAQQAPNEVISYQEEQPQDLSLKSLKRKAPADFEAHDQPAKREYVLNLSKQRYRAESPISVTSDSPTNCALLSPKTDFDSPLDYQNTNIHLRGLANVANVNPYQTAFVMAAGCNPMSALWNTYQTNMGSIFPSPASSISSASSPYPIYSSYQQMTPPSSPGSDASSEPEDLSVRNDIPLPALFHLFDEAPSSVVPTSTAASAYRTCGTSSHTGATYTASKNYRYKCTKCNKMYSTSMGLSKHEQFHCPAAQCNQDKKQHACKECGKLYTSVGALKMHIRTHTLPCKCPICGKAFSRPWLLQGHIRTHTGEKPFQCSDCPRSFADRSNLRAHQQTHVDIKKYACKVCHKSFSRMSLLNKHANSNCTITIA